MVVRHPGGVNRSLGPRTRPPRLREFEKKTAENEERRTKAKDLMRSRPGTPGFRPLRSLLLAPSLSASRPSALRFPPLRSPQSVLRNRWLHGLSGRPTAPEPIECDGDDDDDADDDVLDGVGN